MTRLISLNSLFASTIKNHQSSVVEFSSQIFWTPWTGPSILVISPAHSWSSWHVMVDPSPVTFSTILVKIRRHVSPKPTRHTTGFFYSTIRQPNVNAWYTAQGELPLANQSKNISTLVYSLVLSPTNFRSYSGNLSDSVPPGLELFKSLRATDSAASSVMSMGMKIGVSLYVSIVAQEGIVSLGCFSSKTNMTVLLIVPVQSSANISCCKTPTHFPVID